MTVKLLEDKSLTASACDELYSWMIAAPEEGRLKEDERGKPHFWQTSGKKEETLAEDQRRRNKYLGHILARKGDSHPEIDGAL